MRCVTSLDPCDLCRCHRRGAGDRTMSQFNFSRHARWKLSLITPAEWRLMFADRHMMFQPPWYFMSQHNCASDELHVMYLGVYMVLLGSVLWLLCYRMLPGLPTENVETVWSMMREYYTEHGVTSQFTSFSLNSFTDPEKHCSNYPRLKGRGYEIKSALLPLAHIFKHFKNRSNNDEMIMEALEIMIEIDGTFDTYVDDWFLPDFASSRVLVLADCFLERYAALHNAFTLTGDLLFHTLPKHHVFWHLCYRSKFEHPRLGNTALDEDFVGRVKEIVQGSSSGVPLHGIPSKVLTKFMWGKTMLYLNTNV